MRNEWRANLLLMFELLLVSVVMWFCLDYIVESVMVYAEPRGHDISHTYYVNFGRNEHLEGCNDVDDIAEFVDRIRRRPEVEAAALSLYSVPYTGGMRDVNMWDQDTISPVYVRGLHRWVESDFFRVFRIRGMRGETPERLAEILRPGINVVGVTDNAIVDSLGNHIDAVGMIGHLFNLGGYPDHTLAAVTVPMKRFDYEPYKSNWCGGIFDMMSAPARPVANELSVRIHENMDDGSFPEKLMTDAESINFGRYYVMSVNSFSELRRCAQVKQSAQQRNMATGLVFLLVNIFLCIFGTFWYRTHLRTSEIAIHKISGASSACIMGRLIGEGLILLLLVTPLAFAADRALVHLEIVKTYTFTMQHHLLVAVGTTLLMAVMIAVGIWVPAYRAGRISPALALRSE